MYMKRFFKYLACLFLVVTQTIGASAQGINPTVEYEIPDTSGITSANPLEASAPVIGHFKGGVENPNGDVVSCRWNIYRQGDSTAIVSRFDEDMDYTFRETGTFSISFQATFYIAQGKLVYECDVPFVVSIYESKLVMPNAFSPNGDHINDIYGAKPGYQSIVEFHATIFNRWGQKIYEWHDPAGGWDGTFHGKQVADGVYFVLVRARGADGRKFNIRRDVNILRGYTDTTRQSDY